MSNKSGEMSKIGHYFSNFYLTTAGAAAFGLLISGFVFSPLAGAYPLEQLEEQGGSSDFSGLGLTEANRLSQTIGEMMSSFVSIDFLKNFAGGADKIDPRAGFPLTDFKLWESGRFSGQDLVQASRAIAILFLQVMIAMLSVGLGILKLALGALV